MRFFFIFFLFVFGTCRAQELEYLSTSLEEAPLSGLRTLDIFFREQGFLAFKNTEEFPEIGLNQIYFTHDFSSFVSVKYNVKGNFPIGELLRVEDGDLIHIKYDEKIIAFYFSNVSHLKIGQLLPNLKKLSLLPKTSLLERLSPIGIAHAEEDCRLPGNALSNSNTISTMASVASSTVISALSRCLSGASEEIKSSSGFSFAKSVGNEAKRLWKNPGKRINEYWGATKEVVSGLGTLMYAICDAIIHPQEASARLGALLGDVGKTLGTIIGVLAKIPGAAVSMVCSFITGIGVRSLIAAISGGAAAILLATKLGRIVKVLETIGNLIQKMKIIGATRLEHLGLTEENFTKVFSKLSSGTLEERKLSVFVGVLDEKSELAKTMAKRGLLCAL